MVRSSLAAGLLLAALTIGPVPAAAQTGNEAGQPALPPVTVTPPTQPQLPMQTMPMAPGQMVPGQMMQGQVPGAPQSMPPVTMPAPQVPGAPVGQMPAAPGQLPGPAQPPIAAQPEVPGQLPQAQPVAPLPGQPLVQADTTGEGGVRAILDFAKQVTQGGSLQAQTSAPAGWERYIDRSVATVGVIYPKGWTVVPLVRGTPTFLQFASIQVSSPDGFHYVEGVSTQQTSPVDPQAQAEAIIQRYAARLGFKRVMVSESWTVAAGSFPVNFFCQAVEAGDYIILVVTYETTMAMGGMSLSILGHRVVAGPTAQFSSMAPSTYIPILSSMLGW